MTGWEKWRVTEKERKRNCRGTEGETDSEGEETERQKSNRAIKTRNNGIDARSLLIQFLPFTNGETEAELEQVTSPRSHGVNSQ